MRVFDQQQENRRSWRDQSEPERTVGHALRKAGRGMVTISQSVGALTKCSFLFLFIYLFY